MQSHPKEKHWIKGIRVGTVWGTTRRGIWRSVKIHNTEDCSGLKRATDRIDRENWSIIVSPILLQRVEHDTTYTRRRLNTTTVDRKWDDIVVSFDSKNETPRYLNAVIPVSQLFVVRVTQLTGHSYDPPRHTVPYHLGRRGLDLLRLTPRPVNSGPLHMPYQNGKVGWRLYPSVGGALLRPLFDDSACV